MILDSTAVGRRHRDHTTTGSTLKSVNRSALHTYFFGEDGKQKLKISKFLDFQSRLQEEISRLEVICPFFNNLRFLNSLILSFLFLNI